jgi:hypothetical protein
VSGIGPILSGLDEAVREAVRLFWTTREAQVARQREAGRDDAGARGAVTGGAQMDGFISLLSRLLTTAGVRERDIFRKQRIELPGYYRPTKQWDLLVVAEGKLLAAIETKSQVGPSFGNNFNNRTEEAMGSAMDLWTAFREGAFNGGTKPWLGYLFLLEECPNSISPVKVKEPHFKVLPEFVDASYKTRYEIFCRKLVRERNYDAAAFLFSQRTTLGCSEPAADLAFELFVRSMIAHVTAFAGAAG